MNPSVIHATIAGAIAAMFCGYGLNFQNLFQYQWPSSEFIASALGIFFPPLGVFMGWFF